MATLQEDYSIWMVKVRKVKTTPGLDTTKSPKDWNWNHQGKVNHPGLLFPANVACVLNEVEVLWQIGENVKKIYSFKEQVH
jgi:hypothetical protein